MGRPLLLVLTCILAGVATQATVCAQHVLPAPTRPASDFTCWPMPRFELTEPEIDECFVGTGFQPLLALDRLETGPHRDAVSAAALEVSCVGICHEQWAAGPWWTMREYARDQLDKVLHDFRHNYTGRHLLGLGLALAIAAPLANTDADQNFQRYYQSHVRTRDLGKLADVANSFGEHWNVVPIVVAAALGGQWASRYWEGGAGVATWGDRSARAMLVGAPAVGLLQFGLGAGRPEEGSSRWRPFNDNNAVAGHGFIGAVPFLAAATVVESRPLKMAFFAGSFLTTWARVNDDSHYLSQAVLGWSIAYLAVQSVQQTDFERRRVSLVPLDLPDGAGVALLIRY